MDQLDQKLIGRLRLNARESVAELARQLDISRTTIQDRLTRMERNGTIQGYTLQLDEIEDERQIRSFVTIVVEPQKTNLIAAELKTFHQINAIHSVSGKFDLLVEIGTSEIGEMDKILDKICDMPGVKNTESSIILSTKLKR